MQIYRIPDEQNRTEIKIQKSFFVATIAYATSVDEAKGFIGKIRAEMPDANHHVYAFRIGYGNSIIEGMSDDGEPKGTSGPPTLAVLRGSDLGDVVLVTARYFGGIKLGKGGLVRAYTESAQQVLSTLKTKLNIPTLLVKIEIPYHLYEIVKHTIQQNDGKIQDETFSANVEVTAEFDENEFRGFKESLTEKTSGQAIIKSEFTT